MNDRFFTARTLCVFLGALGVFGLLMGGWMLTQKAPIFVGLALLASGLVLLPLAIVEWRVPVLEVTRERIVMRQARMRAAFVAERPSGVALDVRPHLLGWQIVATNGERWVTGRLAELAVDQCRALLVPARALAPSEKKRLGESLRAWAASG